MKVPYSERPPGYDYRLTDMGRDLWPVITTMRQWGDKHAAPEGPPLELVHEPCGEIAEPLLGLGQRCRSLGSVRMGPEEVLLTGGRAVAATDHLRVERLSQRDLARVAAGEGRRDLSCDPIA